jgi:hypothetical protein
MTTFVEAGAAGPVGFVAPDLALAAFMALY